MRTTHIYYIGSSRFWSVDLSWYHPNWARDLLITLVIAWHKTSCHNLLCIFFFLCVCAPDCRSKYFPYQFFFCYFWDILTILFLYKSTKYFKFQSSVTDTLFSYFYDWNYLAMIWGEKFIFILFKDIVIFYTYKIEWKLFQTKYHEPRFSHTAFPRCIFKFISNQCNL